jgi:hypothetical protein
MQLQLSFSLRVSSSIKQVHLLGSWDSYTEHIPLSKDKSSSKTWSGTFRFPSDLVQPGQRYWYYYILDGYHITYNPQEDSTVEPTTGRELNILDVSPSGSSASSYKSKSKSTSSSSPTYAKGSSRRSSSGKRHRQRASLTLDIPKGRPLPPSQIVSPRPISPKSPRHLLDAQEEDLANRLAQTGLYDRKGRPRHFDKFRIVGDGSPGGLGVDLDDDEVLYDYYYYDNEYGAKYQVADGGAQRSSAASSPGTGFTSSASGSSLSSPGPGSGSPTSSSLSFSSGSSSPLGPTSSSKQSSLSGYSTPDSECSGCTCERYGITRKGERMRLDCGGARCGYDETCSSSDDDRGAIRLRLGGVSAGGGGGMRRNGVIIRR